MELSLMNLTNEDVTKYLDYINKIMNESFPELNQKYNAIRLIVFRSNGTENDQSEKAVKDFIGGSWVSLTGKIFPIRSTANPPKACLEINLSSFELYEDWKQAFAIRHECLHLLIKTETSITLKLLMAKYEVEKIKDYVRFQHEYVVHYNMIKKWPKDWLKEPLGISPSNPNPAITAYNVRITNGRKAAMLFSIEKIVHILTILKLYESIPDELKQLLRSKKTTAKKCLQSFTNALRIDSKSFPQPSNWFEAEDFLNEEKYFQKIEKLLALTDNE